MILRVGLADGTMCALQISRYYSPELWPASLGEGGCLGTGSFMSLGGEGGCCGEVPGKGRYGYTASEPEPKWRAI